MFKLPIDVEKLVLEVEGEGDLLAEVDLVALWKDDPAVGYPGLI